MMTAKIPTLMRQVLAPALAAVLIAGMLPAVAQDSEQTEEIEAREDVAPEEAFTPPLTGAPKQRMGAASRLLGVAENPCAEEESETAEAGKGAVDSEGADEDCVGAEAVSAETEAGESGEASQ